MFRYDPNATVPAMPTACSYSLPKRNWRQRSDFRRRALDRCARGVCRPSL